MSNTSLGVVAPLRARVSRRGSVPIILVILSLWLRPVSASHVTFDYLKDDQHLGYVLDIDGNKLADRLTGEHDALQSYTVIEGAAGCFDGGTGDFGTVFLKPINPKPLHAVSQTFLDTLLHEFPIADGWSYTSPDQAPLVAGRMIEGGLSDNSLVVHTYDAQHPEPNLVGAQFHVSYTGSTPAHIRWIQVVATNHQRDLPHPSDGRRVDTKSNATPFYDDGATADEKNFYDHPGRPDDCNNHSWSAELWVVTSLLGPNAGPGNVSFYGGVEWGWGNRVLHECDDECAAAPEPSTWLLVLSGGLVWLAHRVRHVRRRRLCTSA